MTDFPRSLKVSKKKLYIFEKPSIAHHMEETLAEFYQQCTVQYNTVQLAVGWLIQYLVQRYPANGLYVVITTLLATGTKNISLQSQMTMIGASFILQSLLLPNEAMGIENKYFFNFELTPTET